MGCPFLKYPTEAKQSASIKFDDLRVITVSHVSHRDKQPRNGSSLPPRPPPPNPPSPRSSSQSNVLESLKPLVGSSAKLGLPGPLPNFLTASGDQRRIQLHTPIYVASRACPAKSNGSFSFEKGDEMELIQEMDASQLDVRHLRSGERGIVLKNLVTLDVDTPLRLATKDSGIIQKCLMQHNVLGGYLIRRSSSISKAFVLSIAQYNQNFNTFYWHYLISIHQNTKRFYFSKEDRLEHLSFSSFKQLISNPQVLQVVPLSEILPYTIEFEVDVWKIPLDQLEIKEQIGKGYFGEVYRGSWHKSSRTISVAIKKLRIQTVTNTLRREVEAMKNLTNIYIVSLYGITIDPNTKETYIITELMENGDLKSWLKKSNALPKHSILFGFAKDIACGMTFLEIRQYVHRDLACRNILLSSFSKSVKIADFGLSVMLGKDKSYRSEEAQYEKIPVRSTAPEVLADGSSYSIKSDVWSYGIVLIELWLKGADPYEHQCLPWIKSAVMNAHVHEKPIDCPNDFYESIIRKCLAFKPEDRPSFAEIRRLLDEWLC